jgi:hypothetical protein
MAASVLGKEAGALDEDIVAYLDGEKSPKMSNGFERLRMALPVTLKTQGRVLGIAVVSPVCCLELLTWVWFSRHDLNTTNTISKDPRYLARGVGNLPFAALIRDADAGEPEEVAEVVSTHIEGARSIADIASAIRIVRGASAPAPAPSKPAATAASSKRRERRLERAKAAAAEADTPVETEEDDGEEDPEVAAARALMDRTLAGDEASAAELGSAVLLPSDDAGSVSMLLALCPGALPDAVGRFLRVFGGDTERCAEWLLEAVSLPPHAAATVARGIAADPAAATAGAGGVGLARSLHASSALTSTAEAAAATAAAAAAAAAAATSTGVGRSGSAAAGSAGTAGEAGGIKSIEAADTALRVFVGLRAAQRQREEEEKAAKRGGALSRVLLRYDEQVEKVVDAKTQKKLSRRGVAMSIDGVPLTPGERHRADRKARRKDRAQVVRFRDGRAVHVKIGDKFI